MSSTSALLRDVEESDLGIFYEHQLEPGAFEMAAFSPRRKEEDHLAHWRNKILADDTVYAKTVVVDDNVAGNVVSWLHDGHRIVGYWIGCLSTG